jgi:undecaprenyl-diphosphatase
MNILETIKSLDVDLFLLINRHFSPFFDNFMFAFSEKLIWIPLYISVLFLLIKTRKKEAIWLILALILCIVISDQVSSGILKDLVKRLRPSHAEDLKGMVHLVRNYSGGLYGFASSHAANAVGFALLSSLIFKRKLYTYAIFTWAAITAYSRIYLGVHYPLDVLGGAAIGIVAALFCYWLLIRLRLHNPPQPITSTHQYLSHIPTGVLLLSHIGIIVYSLII